MNAAMAPMGIDEPTAARAGAPRGELKGELCGELRSEQTLAALPSAVGAARLFVLHTLSAWQPGRDCDNNDEWDDRNVRIEGAVQALVMHSVATTGVSSSGPLYRDDYDRLQLIVVRLRMASGLLLGEVWDRTEASPHPQLGDDAAVRATDEYAYAMPIPGRRVVWCAVRSGPLSRRTPLAGRPPRLPASSPPPDTEHATGHVAGQAAWPTTDVLHRVLDGLRDLGPEAS